MKYSIAIKTRNAETQKYIRLLENFLLVQVLLRGEFIGFAHLEF